MMLQPALLLFCAMAQAPPAVMGDVPDASAVYERALPSVLWLVVSGKDKQLSGSAVIIDASRGLALTAAHCVGGKDHADYSTVAYAVDRDASGDVYNKPEHYRNRKDLAIACELLGILPLWDLALLRLKAVPPTARSIPIALSSARPGGEVIAIGTSGSVNVLWRFADGKCRAVYDDKYHFDDGQEIACKVIETSIPTNPGDSGGPMLNLHGELLGITSANCPTERLIQKGISSNHVWRFLHASRRELTLTTYAGALRDAKAGTRRWRYTLLSLSGDDPSGKSDKLTHYYDVITAADGRVTTLPLVSIEMKQMQEAEARGKAVDPMTPVPPPELPK